MKGSPLIGLIICTLSPEADAIVRLLSLACQMMSHAKRVGQSTGPDRLRQSENVRQNESQR